MTIALGLGMLGLLAYRCWSIFREWTNLNKKDEDDE